MYAYRHRTFDDWDDPAPGHFEADLVSHSGPVARGSFAQTLVLTDIATGWTECAPLLFREQSLLTSVLEELRRHLPMTMLGFDTDNDSAFMNETVRDWCAAAEITFTRCRPYRKNDQAWVEQKNGAIVRRMVGYHRYEGVAAPTHRVNALPLRRWASGQYPHVMMLIMGNIGRLETACFRTRKKRSGRSRSEPMSQ